MSSVSSSRRELAEGLPRGSSYGYVCICLAWIIPELTGVPCRWRDCKFVNGDANFRQRSQPRKLNDQKPSVINGRAYYVPREPFRAHLLNGSKEVEVWNIFDKDYHHNNASQDSTCSSFRTIAAAQLKPLKGTVASGVGKCIIILVFACLTHSPGAAMCSRHENFAANGWVDLQKGEA
jgi:hypothetical protein